MEGGRDWTLEGFGLLCVYYVHTGFEVEDQSGDGMHTI